MSVSGKVVLVTGGAGGLGKAFVEGFLSNGSKVCVADVCKIEGQKMVDDMKTKYSPDDVIFASCDVTSDDSFNGAFNKCKEKLGAVDILVNNAGVGNENNWNLTFNVNLGGVIRGTELAISAAQNAGVDGDGKKRSCVVVNIASIAALKTIPFGPYYGASKAAIVQYTRAVGHPFNSARTGVCVQVLCPSMVDTPFLEKSLQSRPEAVTQVIKKTYSSLKLLSPRSVFDALMQLLSEAKPGGVLVVESEKQPYYVENTIPS